MWLRRKTDLHQAKDDKGKQKKVKVFTIVAKSVTSCMLQFTTYLLGLVILIQEIASHCWPFQSQELVMGASIGCYC